VCVFVFSNFEASAWLSKNLIFETECYPDNKFPGIDTTETMPATETSEVGEAPSVRDSNIWPLNDRRCRISW